MKVGITQESTERGDRIAVQAGEKVLEFHVDRAVRLANYDCVVWPLLIGAMRAGESLEIDGPITAESLFHAETLQVFLHRYLGLAPIEIRAAEVFATTPSLVPRTLLPFSGGVDSTFSLLYNRFALGRKIEGAMMVRGLDMFDEQEFRLCCERCRPILELAEVEPIHVRTNFRPQFVTPLGWKLHSDFLLAGMLHLFHREFGYAFISGDGDAGLLSVRQCFQTPFLNERMFFLFSSDHLLIQNFEGANLTKIEKIAYLSQFAEVRENLRVCWKYRSHDNCGQCTKCVLTQLDFVAVMGVVPPCFPVPAAPEALQALFKLVHESTGNDPDSARVIIRKEFARVLRVAAKNNITHPMLDLVRGAELHDAEGIQVP
jgi:hypothetical protein